MKAGKYTIQELFVNRYLDQLVIPEMQRDYVWQKEQVEGLLNSIGDDFQKFLNAKVPSLDACEENSDIVLLRQDFEDFYKKRNYSSNIGFIYAYSDSQYDGRYFLIDGQQRITTIYLALLILAARANRAVDFEKYFCNEKLPKLNYRVRDSSRDFLYCLVPFILANPKADITDQAWHLSSFKNDVTISNIIRNLDDIAVWLNRGEIDESAFFDYLRNFTELWYFDTNISVQGENLYIYLNARGEHVQANENVKAEILGKYSDVEDKNTRGREWEEWQDFFWQHRTLRKGKANINADRGFNEFLACIAGLDIFLNNDSNKWLGDKWRVQPTVIIQLNVLNFEIISKYINCLRYVSENKNEICEKYDYAGWIDDFIKELWINFNSEKTYWINDYRSDLLSKERNRMVFVWGVLYWLSEGVSAKKDVITIFRGIRKFYLRYKNNNRAVLGEHGVIASVNNLITDGFISREEGKEEYIKERWLSKLLSDEDRITIESVIWEIEDHPYNIDGSDVGMTNISHLLSFDTDLTYEKLQKTKSAFYECFPLSKSQSAIAKFPVIQSVLLHYSDFFNQKSPWYYKNYHFTEWKRNVRPLVSGNRGVEFSEFLQEFIASKLTIDQFLESKRQAEPSKDVTTLREQLLWYNFHLREDMWKAGGYIALNDRYTEHEYDRIFRDKQPFWRSNGEFRSGYLELSTMLPDGLIKDNEREATNG